MSGGPNQGKTTKTGYKTVLRSGGGNSREVPDTELDVSANIDTDPDLFREYRYRFPHDVVYQALIACDLVPYFCLRVLCSTSDALFLALRHTSVKMGQLTGRLTTERTNNIGAKSSDDNTSLHRAVVSRLHIPISHALTRALFIFVQNGPIFAGLTACRPGGGGIPTWKRLGPLIAPSPAHGGKAQTSHTINRGRHCNARARDLLTATPSY